MELFKQFAAMLENFIISIVDKRLAETPKEQTPEIVLEKAVLKLLNQDCNSDEITPVEAAIRQIAKDAIGHKYVTEREMEAYCEDFIETDELDTKFENEVVGTSLFEKAVRDSITTDMIRDAIRDADIIEDEFFDNVANSDRFTRLVCDTLKDRL